MCVGGLAGEAAVTAEIGLGPDGILDEEEPRLSSRAQATGLSSACNRLLQ